MDESPIAYELVELTKLPDVSIPQVQLLADAARETLYEALGHSFGYALRVAWTNTNSATITVSDTKITLKVDTSTYELPFADYPTLGQISQAIIDLGGISSLVPVIPYNQPSRNLYPTESKDCLDKRCTLRLQYWTENLKRTRPFIITSSLPILDLHSLTIDGIKISSSHYIATEMGITLINPYPACAPGRFYDIELRYRPTYFALSSWHPIAVIVIQLFNYYVEKYKSGSIKSERIGDYSYDTDTSRILMNVSHVLEKYMARRTY